MADDAELALKAAKGDREAAGEIYDRYASLLRAILLDATGSLPEANDLLQEVFLRALTKLTQLRDPSALCGWLVGIARREGIDYRRRAVRQRKQFTPLVEEPPPSSEPFSAHDIDWVRNAIRNLPERERDAIHIYYLYGESAEVCRQVLGMSLSGFHKLLARARESLRTRLLNPSVKK